jgi:hypothetical protein
MKRAVDHPAWCVIAYKYYDHHNLEGCMKRFGLVVTIFALSVSVAFAGSAPLNTPDGFQTAKAGTPVAKNHGVSYNPDGRFGAASGEPQSLNVSYGNPDRGKLNIFGSGN